MLLTGITQNLKAPHLGTLSRDLKVNERHQPMACFVAVVALMFP